MTWALVTALVYSPPNLDLLPLVGRSTASLPRLPRLVPLQALGVRYISPWIFFRTKRVVPYVQRSLRSSTVCGIIIHRKRVTYTSPQTLVDHPLTVATPGHSGSAAVSQFSAL